MNNPEYNRLKITIGEHKKLSRPVLVNVTSGIMHAINGDCVLCCHQCRTIQEGSNKVSEILKLKRGYAILEYESAMPYIACKVCEQKVETTAA